MASSSQQPKPRDGVLTTLKVVIRGLDLAKDACGFPPAQAVFGSVSALLTIIMVRFPLVLRDDELLTHVYSGRHG